jgi:hypothetical protein
LVLDGNKEKEKAKSISLGRPANLLLCLSEKDRALAQFPFEGLKVIFTLFSELLSTWEIDIES